MALTKLGTSPFFMPANAASYLARCASWRTTQSASEVPVTRWTLAKHVPLADVEARHEDEVVAPLG